ncbi:MAG TPA: threo-3-hydroxy-L-aspartate ammonia-lyase [Beijerinckiaceae bacterium]|nr:threo-3-hydroxy-L-aspartate ammonia-lyase [Beijerinckiaceae bacterium]
MTSVTGLEAAPPQVSVPTFDDVRAAARRISGIAQRTPVLTSRTADARTGAKLFFKCENLQRVGAFKFRGAYNAIAGLGEEQRRRGVITFSSGNHAQAMALAAQLQGVKVTVIMPHDAPAMKVAATRGYGAEIVFYDRFKEDREAMGRELAAQGGLTLIPPFDHPGVIAGQGTAALELIEEVGALDVLLAPLGGGGLLAGCALAAKALSPGCSVIGVEPEAGNDGQQSFRKGEIVRIPVPQTIADGAMTTSLGAHTFAVMRGSVDDVLTVPDRMLVAAMRFFLERMKIVVEPTGCLAAAAVLEGVYPCAGKRVGVILSGGNIDLQSLRGFLE